MFQRILIAIDFSEPSVGALQSVAAMYPGAELVLCHAIEPERDPSYLRQAMQSELAAGGEKELDVRANLEHLAEEVGERCRIAIGHGWPPREIERLARESGSDLVVVAAHTRRIWPWDAPGATVEAVVEQSDRPVLVWREGSGRGEGTVLAAVDLRDGGEPVIELAAGCAETRGTPLVLLHVLPGTFQAYLRAVSSPSKVEESLRKIAESARADALRKLPTGAEERLEVRVLVMRGRPITQILSVAEMEAAELIVMGRSQPGRSTERVVLGSVTGKVLRGANCSVLAVPL